MYIIASMPIICFPALFGIHYWWHCVNYSSYILPWSFTAVHIGLVGWSWCLHNPSDDFFVHDPLFGYWEILCSNPPFEERWPSLEDSSLYSPCVDFRASLQHPQVDLDQHLRHFANKVLRVWSFRMDQVIPKLDRSWQGAVLHSDHGQGWRCYKSTIQV